MAFDSKQKRQNVLGVARPWVRSHFAGENSEFWRASAGNIYAGNALSFVTIPTNINTPAKRQNVLGVARPWVRSHFAGTNNAMYRASIGNAYGGNVESFSFKDAQSWGESTVLRKWNGQSNLINWKGQKQVTKWN